MSTTTEPIVTRVVAVAKRVSLKGLVLLSSGDIDSRLLILNWVTYSTATTAITTTTSTSRRLILGTALLIILGGQPLRGSPGRGQARFGWGAGASVRGRLRLQTAHSELGECSHNYYKDDHSGYP